MAQVGGATTSAGTGPARSRKLVLCFDGTGNAFSGSNSDTNVVKLLSKLDRNDPDQFHYYQTGIGTYDIDATSVDRSWIASFMSSIEQTMDQGFGTGFDAHVLAGYRFLMRYYDSGDKIYMFGFSRGAFTAKFLARMINTVGLLCKGNEEMVPFAYRLYQRYLAGDVPQLVGLRSHGHDHDNNVAVNGVNGANVNGATSFPATNGIGPTTPLLQSYDHDHDHDRDGHDEIAAFSNTFCRKEQVIHKGHVEEQNIKVYFLGMWDCVSSVAVLERSAPVPVAITGTAKYVRHAVAVDERRVKFKAALLAQDIRTAKGQTCGDDDDHAGEEDIKEVWFPGCHGDVGGGWPATADNPLDSGAPMTTWQRVKNFWTSRKANTLASAANKYLDAGPFQMSDIPLAWMIREVELVGRQDEGAALRWKPDLLDRFKRRFQRKKKQALTSLYHDSLAFGYGTGFFKVLFWKFMEWLPAIKRWELEGDTWRNVRFPLNKGNTRDIPPDAVLHESLLWRLLNIPSYRPTNNHGGQSAPCLKHEGRVPDVQCVIEPGDHEPDPDHLTYHFLKPNLVG
ncbi:hypothetical protein B0H63DRAFT_408362 [Podospora didyma]|uniref:T6SS Phospholipase effector Tle1-like catalytic domain-containing protein n=1 Tax=Podospora didyma TaxID=330526 RepID=A0AAE0P843_9PEZI|nr:hypothetical protein B0H63DRAFT_408362 [Podospora didyma]